MDLRLSNISKRYDDVMVLKNLTSEFTTGIYGILGANGSGKSTLFQIISGALKPSQGEMLFNGQNIHESPADFRAILGYLPQNFSYYPDFTGMNFMLYIAALKGLHPSISKKKCHKLLTLVGLDTVKNKKIKTYSGGMKQRLGIAQALINNPKVLILDEPTVGLDPKERVRFRNLISSLSQDKIILLSTHIVSDVEYISDEILILKNGQFANRGTANDLLKAIQNRVWEISGTPFNMQQLSNKYIVSNQRNEEGQMILRIISSEKPASEAQQVEGTLEDLYLYYFQEEAVTCANY